MKNFKCLICNSKNFVNIEATINFDPTKVKSAKETLLLDLKKAKMDVTKFICTDCGFIHTFHKEIANK